MYIHGVLHFTSARRGSMASLPRFASPVAQERRAYFRALYQWFHTGSGPPVEAPEDPLRPIARPIPADVGS